MRYENVKLYREDHPMAGSMRMVLTNTVIPRTEVKLYARKGLQGHPARIGTVTDIRRADDGWVTGTLDTPDTITGAHSEAGFTASKGRPRLAHVMLGNHPAWEGMEIQ